MTYYNADAKVFDQDGNSLDYLILGEIQSKAKTRMIFNKLRKRFPDKNIAKIVVFDPDTMETIDTIE